MLTHVKVLAVLYIVLSGIGLLFALVVFFAMGTAAGIVGMSAPPEDAAVAIPVLGITATAVAAFLLILSLPGLITGWGLLKLRPWARILGIVLAVISLINIPVGTAIGIYGLWVLLTKETEGLFNPAAPAPPARPAV
ncbi:MAG TPA: hypothetical protein VK886_06965 [Vicinamibacterales bacterium]|nr:hypothetical protein [Vicinamibacterales bacterium]